MMSPQVCSAIALLFWIYDWVHGQFICAQSSIAVRIPSPDHLFSLLISEVVVVRYGHELLQLGDRDEAVVILG